MQESITKNCARFTQLTPGLVRLEYSPSGIFEDRRSIRAISRPAGTAFSAVTQDDTSCILSTESMRIEYGGGGFTAETLCVRDAKSGEMVWNPDSVDELNLGGVHVSMDCIKPGLIPHGVHPATIKQHHVGTEQCLWSFKTLCKPEDGGKVGEIGDGANLPNNYDEILAARPLDSLPGAAKDLIVERMKYPPGILSRAGYFLYNDTSSPRLNSATGWVEDATAEEGYLDLYLFYYRNDFHQAMKDYQLLFGKAPVIPRYSLGLWYSRYPTFSQQEIYDLVETFETYNLPLDVFVFDLEWHKRGWCGFDWDTDHIPTPDSLLRFLRERDIHTTFNVHPGAIPVEDERFAQFMAAAGLTCREEDKDYSPEGMPHFSKFDLAVKQEAAAFMDVFHKPVQDQGVDFWWIDGTAPVEKVKGLDRQIWTNHVYQEHIQKHYTDRRAMILSRAPGLGSHRYPFLFTGDTWSYFGTLKNQVEQTLRAGHIGHSYITHDIGGHISTGQYIDPELYMRWVQFAALSPVIRLHSSKIEDGIGGERRPWMYGSRVMQSFHAAMVFRMKLIPYLYTLAKESFLSGLPMCRSNCLQQPDWEEGYEQWDAYFLGERIYAAPLVNPGTLRTVILPRGIWYHGLNGNIIESDGKEQRIEISPFTKAPLHFIKAGTIIIRQPYYTRAAVISSLLEIDLYPLGRDNREEFILREDDGMTQGYVRGEESQQRFIMEEAPDALTLVINPSEGEFSGKPWGRSYFIRIGGETVMETAGLATSQCHCFTFRKGADNRWSAT